MMTKMAVGDAQPPRLDSGSGDADTGYKLTAVYFLGEGWSNGDGGELLVRNCHGVTAAEGGAEEDAGEEGEDLAKFETIEPRPDRLVIFRSRHVLNGIQKIEGKGSRKPQYAVTFWIHGGQIEDLD
jgi:hypothetical protein